MYEIVLEVIESVAAMTAVETLAAVTEAIS